MANKARAQVVGLPEEDKPTNLMYLLPGFNVSSATLLDHDHDHSGHHHRTTPEYIKLVEESIKSHSEDILPPKPHESDSSEIQTLHSRATPPKHKYLHLQNPVPSIRHDERTITVYLLLNLVLTVLGIISLLVSLVLHLLETSMAEFLFINHIRTALPSTMMFFASLTAIILGISAIVAFFTSATLFFKVYEDTLWLVLFMNVASISTSIGSWKLFNAAAYERIFEAEAIYVRSNYTDRNYLDLWKFDVSEGFWDRMQIALKCCGMYSPGDWLTLGGTIVDSCCRTSKIETCVPALAEWRKNKSVSTNEAILELLFKKPCAEVLALEITNFQRDWVLFSSIFAFFNFLILLNGKYFNRKLRALFTNVLGSEVIETYQNYFCAKWRQRRQMPKKVAEGGLLSALSKIYKVEDDDDDDDDDTEMSDDESGEDENNNASESSNFSSDQIGGNKKSLSKMLSPNLSMQEATLKRRKRVPSKLPQMLRMIDEMDLLKGLVYDTE